MLLGINSCAYWLINIMRRICFLIFWGGHFVRNKDMFYVESVSTE